MVFYYFCWSSILFAAWRFTLDWSQQCVDETKEHHLNLMKKQKSAGKSYHFLLFSIHWFHKIANMQRNWKRRFVNPLWHFFIVKKSICKFFNKFTLSFSLFICFTSLNPIIHSSYSFFHYTEERSNFRTLLESPFFAKKLSLFLCNTIPNFCFEMNKSRKTVKNQVETNFFLDFQTILTVFMGGAFHYLIAADNLWRSHHHLHYHYHHLLN